MCIAAFVRGDERRLPQREAIPAVGAGISELWQKSVQKVMLAANTGLNTGQHKIFADLMSNLIPEDAMRRLTAESQRIYWETALSGFRRVRFG